VVGDQGAVIVSGMSGAGKSTLARHFPGSYLHDDVSLVVPHTGGWQVWYQNAYRPQPGPFAPSVPLRGIHFLTKERSQTKTLPMPPAQAMQSLCEQLFFMGPYCTTELLARAAQIAADVPTFALSHCLADPQAVRIQALFGHLGTERGDEDG
jgi:energy-coupling factor transporter ATP-binding protein EcfA2